MNQIHPTVLIEPGAELGDNNYIGPYCYIGKDVQIGNNNRLEAFVSIGTPPEHKGKHLDPSAGVIILNDCVFKEFVTINNGTEEPTFIGNGVWMLTKSHVGHDALIEHGVNIACGVCVGGHSIIMENANLGLGAMIHQNRVVGPFTMVGMNSTVTKNIWPFTKSLGSPSRVVGINEIGLIRSGIKDTELIKFHEYLVEILHGDSECIEINHSYAHHLKRYAHHVLKFSSHE